MYTDEPATGASGMSHGAAKETEDAVGTPRVTNACSPRAAPMGRVSTPANPGTGRSAVVPPPGSTVAEGDGARDTVGPPAAPWRSCDAPQPTPSINATAIATHTRRPIAISSE